MTYGSPYTIVRIAPEAASRSVGVVEGGIVHPEKERALTSRRPCRWLRRGPLLAVACLLAVSAPAKTLIDINAPSVRKLALAVPVLRRGPDEVGSTHVLIAEILRHDLGTAGLFEVLDPKGYLEDPQRAPAPPDGASYDGWRTVGAELLVRGQVEREGGGIAVELRAYDVFRRTQIFGRRYTAAASEGRQIAHLFANALLEEFTGSAGPYGTRIAYVAQQGKGKELALVDMDGANPRRVTKSGSLSLNPAWSRNGRYLYYTSYLMSTPDLYLLDLTTWKTWIVSRTPGINLSGRDSPDGKELLVTLSKDGNPEIYRMDKSTRALERLTDNRAIDVAPCWSPEGRRIVFVSDRAGNPHLFVMNRDGSGVRRVTHSGSHNGDPDWSPKGDLIAFTGKDERGVFQVYVVDPEGRDVRQLTFGSRDTLDPSWSPDGRFLAVSSTREGKSGIYVFRLGSQEFRRVSPAGEEAVQPAWSPRAP